MNQDLPRWPRIAVAAAAVVGLGVGVAGTAVVVGLADGEDRTTGIDPAGITLVAYDTCDSALHELKAAALPHVGPFGLGGGAAYGEDVAIVDGEAAAAPREAAPGADAAGAKEQSAAGEAEPAPAPDHSTTNNHESDVDEPDIVKTDGRRVVSIADGRLRVVDAATHQQTANLALPGGYATQLLLAGDRALVLTTGGMMVEPMPRDGGIAPGEPAPTGIAPGEPAPTGGGIAPGERAPDGSDSPGEPVPDAPPEKSPPIDEPVDPAYGTQLALVDLTGRGKVLGTLGVEGGYLDARQVGSVARVVVRSTPRLKFSYPDGVTSSADVEAKNRNVVESSSISDWLPRFELSAGGHRSSGQLVECTAVSHPKTYSGEGLLTVLTFDLQRELGTGDPMSIAADGDTVYGTGSKLYIADDRLVHTGEMPTDTPTEKPVPSGGQATEIYQFDISSPGRPVHVASGGVPGSLLNQYSLSEHEGNLRVATTVGMTEQSHSMVSVLTRRGNELAQVGQVDGLGKGERIYAVRFVGDTAYVVTFRQTDPLYTVDLSEPSKPRVTGELKITGYSAYLHPVGPDRLLGVGQEATAEGMQTGTQVSLFDTSDERGAKRLGQLEYGRGHAEVESDPHAFLYWPDRNLVVIPTFDMVAQAPGTFPDSGALVLTISGNTISEKGMVRHEVERSGGMPFMPRRALVVGDELWTVSETGMLVSNLDTLAQVAWLPFT